MTSLARPLGYIALVYWFVFWLLNGVDKFLHGRDLALFTWFGKDRTEQFGKYFDRLDLSADGIAPLLSFCGIVELGVAALFVGAILGSERLLGWAFAACALMFIGFSAWDVVVGDRAELLEHGTYLGVVFITAAFLEATRFQPTTWFHSQNRRPHGLALMS
jgi:hypothetical protein